MKKLVHINGHWRDHADSAWRRYLGDDYILEVTRQESQFLWSWGTRRLTGTYGGPGVDTVGKGFADTLQEAEMYAELEMLHHVSNHYQIALDILGTKTDWDYARIDVASGDHPRSCGVNGHMKSYSKQARRNAKS